MYAYKRETPSHGQWFTRARDEAPGRAGLGVKQISFTRGTGAGQR